MARRIRWVFVALLSMALSGLACSLIPRGPTLPASPIVVSTEAAGELVQILKDAAENSKTGEVTVTVSEEQITSLVALKLAEQPNPPVKDVQVFLRDGQMMIYGTAKVGSLSNQAIIKLDLATTPEGKLEVTVADAKFGLLPVPAAILDAISSGLNEMLSGDVGPQATGVKIISVIIADGQMTLTGSAVR